MLRIPGRGLPLPDGAGRGHLLIKLHIAVPTVLTAEQRDLLKLWKAAETTPAQA